MYYYTSVVYEDDFDKLEKLLDNLNMVTLLGHIDGALVSPVHSPEGEEKKKHIHIIWQSSKRRLSRNDLQEFKICGMAANGYVQGVSNRKAMEDYLTHKNNPEKEQFTEPARAYGAYVGSSGSSITDLYAYININNITEYAELINALLGDGEETLASLATSRAYAMQSYLMSKRMSVARHAYEDDDIERK